jgi:hypothetical protein
MYRFKLYLLSICPIDCRLLCVAFCQALAPFILAAKIYFNIDYTFIPYNKKRRNIFSKFSAPHKMFLKTFQKFNMLKGFEALK